MVASGDQYFAQKKYAEATIEYRRAIQEDQTFVPAYDKLGAAYLALNDLKNAYGSFIRAADLAPDNVDLNLRVGNMLLVGRRFQDAKTRARAVLTNEPNNVPGLVLLGNALAGLQSLDEAVDVATRAAALDPKRAGLLSNLGVFELARGNREEAERVFLRAVETDPRAVAPLLALSNLYQSTGRPKLAEQTIRRAIALDAKHVGANSALANLLVQTGRAREAEPFLRAAASAAESLEISLGLADYLIGVGRIAEGLSMLEKLAGTKEGYAASRMRTAIIDHASGRRDEAHATMKELLEREPKNVTAMALEARLLLSENHADEAEAIVKNALKVDPRRGDTHLALGRIYLVKGAIEDARKALTEALSIDPGLVDAQLELSRLHLGRREIETAISYAEAAVKNEPDNVDTLLTLVRTLSIRPDDLSKAEHYLRTLLTRYPNLPDVLSLAGIVALQEEDRGRARQMFERALRVDPDHVEALSGLTTIDAEAGRISDARARIESRLKANKTPGADLLMLAVKVYVAAGDARLVEDALKQMIKADPTRLESYNLLGQFYVSQRRLPEARREFEALAEREPRLAMVQTMLGLLRQATGDRQGAREAFRAAVRIDPRAGPAANNLAWMYATEGGGSLDEALQLAQAARAQMPDSPVTADTLAYVYYKKGMGGFSRPLLEQAILAAPKNPLYHYHLGLVHAQAGEDAKARKSLQAALAIDPKFPGADDARKVISKLIY